MAGETTERDPLPFFYSFRRNEKSTRRNLVQEENFSGSGKYVLVLITDVLPDLFFHLFIIFTEGSNGWFTVSRHETE